MLGAFEPGAKLEFYTSVYKDVQAGAAYRVVWSAPESFGP